MLSDRDIADHYAWLYSSLPAPLETWDHLLAVDGAYTGIKTIDGVHYVMFRGSTTLADWIQDFQHMALPYPDSQLGGVHNGFRAGLLSVKTQIDWICGEQNPLVIVGHSLGAGHAALCAGYRLAVGKRVDALVMFGEPRAGGQKLKEILSKTAVRSYCNRTPRGHDLVTDVPYAAPPLLDYQHPSDLIAVSAPPPAGDAWGLLAFHHFGLYCTALGASGPAARSLAL